MASQRPMAHHEPSREEPTEVSKFAMLQNLIAWRQSRLVDSPEFKKAKRDFLGMHDS